MIITTYCRLAKKGETGMVRAPWWAEPPEPIKIEDAKKDWSDIYFKRHYKNKHKRDAIRAQKLEEMLSGKSNSKSNSVQAPVLSQTPAAIRARQYRRNMKNK